MTSTYCANIKRSSYWSSGAISENTEQKRTKTRVIRCQNAECESDENMEFAVTLLREMRFRDKYQLTSVSFSYSA
jgi:hypothetical protein